MKAACVAPAPAASTRYGERPDYREGLYDLGDGVYAWMVPNGSWGEANAGLVVGDGASLLIDTLWDEPKTQEMLNAMRPFHAAAPITTVVNTHADGDHFWGNALLPEADIVAGKAARAEMDHHKSAAMRGLAGLGRVLALLPHGKARAAGRYFQSMCAPYDFASVRHTPARRTFTGEMDFAVGGRTVRLIEAGPAHTQGDVIVHVPDSGILFAADLLFVGSTPVMWAGPVENWLAALDRMLELDAGTIVPGHGPLTDMSGVSTVKAYWEFTIAEARVRFEAGVAPAQAAWQIVTGEAFRAHGYGAWDSPERMMTNVHLLYRHWQGKPAPLGPAAKINLLRKQADLAFALPDAKPGVMHGSRRL